jgi:hypothetical protein
VAVTIFHEIEMRSAGGANVDRDQPRQSKRRAAGERGRKAPDAVSGAPVKHRADKRARHSEKGGRRSLWRRDRLSAGSGPDCTRPLYGARRTEPARLYAAND